MHARTTAGTTGDDGLGGSASKPRWALRPAKALRPNKWEGWLSNLIADAIANGQLVLVAETQTRPQTVTAQDVIKASVGDYKDAVAA